MNKIIPNYEYKTATKDEIKTQADYNAEFLNSEGWKNLRHLVFAVHGKICLKCNESNISQITIDHIKPKIIYPELISDITNLQVLCKTCNKEKYLSETDYRDEISKKFSYRLKPKITNFTYEHIKALRLEVYRERFSDVPSDKPIKQTYKQKKKDKINLRKEENQIRQQRAKEERVQLNTFMKAKKKHSNDLY